MREAYAQFIKHENVKAFMFEILNGNVPPFITLMAALRGCDQYELADELSCKLRDYLNSVFTMTKYFSVQTSKTYEDYLHENQNAAMLALEYLFQYLASRYSPEDQSLILGAMLEPHMDRKRLYGEMQ